MTMTDMPRTTAKPPKRLAPGTGHTQQTFLVGEEVYLRTFVVGDHKNATSWRSSVFPKSRSLMKEWIKEELPKEGKHQRGHLAIVRKADDVIIGAAKVMYEDVGAEIDVHVDPLYGSNGRRWKAEAITLLADWIVGEQHKPILHVTLVSSDTAVIEAITAFGFRECARFREMRFVDGQRVDLLWFEYLNDGWVKRLGDPKDQPLERTGTGEARPVPPKVTIEGDPPKNAILVGERVYLRPEEKADSKAVAEWARREEETFFDIGRHLVSSVLHEHWTQQNQEKDKPEWIWFSVCLRENDEHIGSVGLLDVDYVNLFAETGSFFHRPEYRGAGYGSEAKQLLLEYAFEMLGLHMVQSWVYFPNTRSAAALRKQGYTESGQINWVYPYEGTFANFVVFDLLADEWRAMPRGKA